MKNSSKLPIGVAIMLTMMVVGVQKGSIFNATASAAETKQEETVSQESVRTETASEEFESRVEAQNDEPINQELTSAETEKEVFLKQKSDKSVARKEKSELHDTNQTEKTSEKSEPNEKYDETLGEFSEETGIKAESEDKIESENQVPKAKTVAKGNGKSVEEDTSEIVKKGDYNVEFTYDNLQYVLKGGTSVELREILNKVGLSGTPTNAVSSNDDLFVVDKVFGEWVVKSRNAFTTKETLSVTIGETVYNILVTDEQSGQCGENVNYTLDDNGTLTITGSGPMYADYTLSDWPWYSDRNSITSVVIGEGVTNTGYGAFYGESNLATVNLPSTLEEIGTMTFCNCSNLTNVALPENLTTIGNSSFSGCSSLTELEIPASVTKIEAGAFSGTGLTGIEIPETVQTMGRGVFSNCKNLTGAKISSTVTITDSTNMFNLCNKLENVTLPGNLDSIGDNMFAGCWSLETIEIPDSVSSIGSSAFMGCYNLTSIEVPDNVNTIGELAFLSCTMLSEIHMSNSVTSIGNKSFYVLASNVDVYYDGNPAELRTVDPNYDNGESTKFVRGGSNNTEYTFHFRYGIVYDGAEVPDDAPKTFYSDTGETITLPNPTVSSGQVFEGWYDNDSFVGNPVTSFDTDGVDSDKTFYAKWRPSQNVHFGGGVQNDALTKTYGDSPFTTALEDIAEGTAKYSSSDPTIASINSSTGKVTIHKAGQATITGTIPATEHYIKTTKSYVLTVNKANNPASLVEAEITGAVGGNTYDLSNNVINVPSQLPDVSTVTYSIVSADAKGCTIDSQTGVLTTGNELTGDNPVIVKVTVSGTDNYNSKELNMSVNVIEKAQETLTVSQEDATYGETLIPPSYTKPSQSGTETLEYTGTLRDGTTIYGPTAEAPTEAGSYNVAVVYETSDTIYSGNADFEISPKNISDAVVTLLGHLVYNGQPQTQAVQSIIVNGENIMDLCNIEGNEVLNAGNYSLTATIMDDTGNYAGFVTKAFTVDKAPSEVGEVTADDLVDTLDPAEVVFHRQDETIPGTFSLVEDALSYGTHTYNWVFTPDDTQNYETATGTVTITVTNTEPEPEPEPDPEPKPEPMPEPEVKPGEPEKDYEIKNGVQTGDSSNLSLWASLLAASPIGYFLNRKRKKK